jgi:hypothetical protein
MRTEDSFHYEIGATVVLFAENTYELNIVLEVFVTVDISSCPSTIAFLAILQQSTASVPSQAVLFLAPL